MGVSGAPQGAVGGPFSAGFEPPEAPKPPKKCKSLQKSEKKMSKIFSWQEISNLQSSDPKTKAIPLDHGVPCCMTTKICWIFKKSLLISYFWGSNLSKILKMKFQKTPSWIFTFFHCLMLYLCIRYSLYGQNPRKYKLYDSLHLNSVGHFGHSGVVP